MSTARTHTESVHPDAATLAAFTDGRLPRAEHNQVVEHLADCSDCFEVVAETAEVLDDLEDGEVSLPGGAFDPAPGAKGVPDNLVIHPRAWRRWAPAAASLAATLAVALVGAWQLGWLTEPDLSVTRLAAPLEEVPSRLDRDAWEDRGLTVVRSGSYTPGEKQGAFEAGVFAIDLQVALQGGNRELAHDAADDLSLVLGGLPGVANLTPLVEDQVLRPLAAGEPLSDIAEAADELAGRLGEPYLSQVHVDLGKWTEAGRLASRAGISQAFRERSFRRALDQLVQAGLPVDVTAKLLEIRERLHGELDSENLELLAEDFWVLQQGAGLRVPDPIS